MTALDCEKIKELLPLYIENELSEEEAEWIGTHLETCAECQKEYAFFASVLENLSSMPEQELPEDFHLNLMRKVRAQTPARRTYIFDFRRIAGFAAAAAVLVLSVVSFMHLEESKKQHANPDMYLTAPAQKEEIKTSPADKTKEPSVPEETIAPRKTSAPKTSIGKQNVQDEMSSGFSRAREIPEDASVEAQSSVAPVMENETQIAAHTEGENFVCVTVSVSERDRAIAELVLSDFEKNETGYVVGEVLEKVLARLATLDGYAVEKEQNETLIENIIILK